LEGESFSLVIIKEIFRPKVNWYIAFGNGSTEKEEKTIFAVYFRHKILVEKALKKLLMRKLRKLISASLNPPLRSLKKA
jgi:hypothetical protein